MSKLNAASVASDMRYDMRYSSRNITIAVAVVEGVCGRAPWKPDGPDILLGGLVISTAVL